MENNIFYLNETALANIKLFEKDLSLPVGNLIGKKMGQFPGILNKIYRIIPLLNKIVDKIAKDCRIKSDKRLVSFLITRS